MTVRTSVIPINAATRSRRCAGVKSVGITKENITVGAVTDRTYRLLYRMQVMDDSVPVWPEQPAIFLDLDGTLLDFADEPGAVEVSERVRDLLVRLNDATGGAIALVSGRTMADLDRLMAPLRFPVAAVHGLERRDGDGQVTRTPVDQGVFGKIERALRGFVEKNPETLLEHKGLTLALHYRKRPELEEAAIGEVRSVLAGLGSDLQIIRGNMVVEIKPTGQDKGSAIVAFMAEAPFVGRTPVFVGDDATDEDGFRTVNELGGVSVKVNSGESVARARLADVDAVLSWLEGLVEL